MPMQVLVVPHDPNWAELFRQEAAAVSAALGQNVVRIHHIGSTAIPGIYAKPIIDLLVEVTDINAVDEYNSAMKELGYESMGEFGITGRRFFRKENAHEIRTHHVHTFASDNPETTRHVAFRDFLIANPLWAQEYSELKRQLTKAHPDSIEDYMDGKDPFIKNVEQLALAWYLS